MLMADSSDNHRRETTPHQPGTSLEGTSGGRDTNFCSFLLVSSVKRKNINISFKIDHILNVQNYHKVCADTDEDGGEGATSIHSMSCS